MCKMTVICAWRRYIKCDRVREKNWIITRLTTRYFYYQQVDWEIDKHNISLMDFLKLALWKSTKSHAMVKKIMKLLQVQNFHITFNSPSRVEIFKKGVEIFQCTLLKLRIKMWGISDMRSYCCVSRTFAELSSLSTEKREISKHDKNQVVLNLAIHVLRFLTSSGKMIFLFGKM